MGFLVLLYGLAAYLAFTAAFAYLVAFTGDLGVPRSVSVGPASSPGQALAVDLGLLALFALQHSLMARPAFKRAWIRLVPPAAERSTYVLASSLALGALYLGWRPLPGILWRVGPPGPRLAIQALFWAGVALALASTFLVSHAGLFGLGQAWARFRNRPYREPPFRLTALYARMRHPLMLGFLVVFWAAPTLTWGRLVFAAGMTAYILAGTWFEERDLLRVLGPDYAAYRRAVPRFFPLPGHRANKPPTP
jgi:protein-S-isoprenylcysteine O-methyltransferase Ste14